MKKSLILGAVALLVIAGFVVGQVRFDDKGSPRNVKSAVVDKFAPDYANETITTGTVFNRASDTPAAKDDAVKTQGCALGPDGGCSNDYEDPNTGPITTIPPVGNLKGTKIIKTGSVEVTVPNDSLAKKVEALTDLLPKGAYVETTSTSEGTAYITVRIPSDNLDATMVAIRKLGKVKSEELSSEDKTFESIDLEARLTIAHQRENAYLALLGKAKTSYDIQAANDQIFAVRQEIETMEGQKRYMNDQVSLSSVTVTLTEKNAKIHEKDKSSMIAKAWKTSVDSLLTTAGGIMIVVAALLPLLIVAAIVAYFVRRAVQRRRGGQHRVETHSDENSNKE